MVAIDGFTWKKKGSNSHDLLFWRKEKQQRNQWPRYYCHMCFRIVNPIMEIEIKCPFSQNGFVEEITGRNQMPDGRNAADLDSDFGGSDRAFFLWVPILLGMKGHPHCRRRFRRLEFDEDNDCVNDGDYEEREAHHWEGDTELIENSNHSFGGVGEA